MSRGGRVFTTLLLLALMAGFGAGVNRFLASRTTAPDAPAQAPQQSKPVFTLPGTIYLAAGGGLFALHGDTFTQLQPQGQGWTQPVLLPGGTGLLAVKVTPNYYSNLYELSLNGTIEKELSNNSSGTVTATDHSADDWIFYPAVAPDNTLYFSYDYPKGDIGEPALCCYQVDFSIWSTKLGSVEINRTNVERKNGITQQSWANYYTGGDVQPVPLNGGGLIYTDYEAAWGGSNQVSSPVPGANPGDEVSQIRMDPKPVLGSTSADGTPLTSPQDDCAEPALNPAQTEIAMICTPVKNGAASSTESDLVVARFDAQTGTIGPLDRIVTGTMAAVPAWSPDGRSLLYLAPDSTSGYFQLWYIKDAATAHPAPPKQVTSGLDLGATSPPVWSAT